MAAAIIDRPVPSAEIILFIGVSLRLKDNRRTVAQRQRSATPRHRTLASRPAGARIRPLTAGAIAAGLYMIPLL